MSMTKTQIKLVIGSLLHDIGKLVFRSEAEDKTESHSSLGYEFLKHDIGVSDNEILNAVRYHHIQDFKNVDLSCGDIAYITFFANKVSSGVYFRGKEEQYTKSLPLKTVFNILNKNKYSNEKKHYGPEFINLNDAINFPRDEIVSLDSDFYKTILSNIKDLKNDLVKAEYTENDIKKLMSFLEAKLSYVPSYPVKKELADISLYDHLKITACYASCVESYLKEKGISDYKTKLFDNFKESSNENMFLLFSMDVSGIQSFIYTITTKKALKQLRARSLYLEIMMEHLVDELLTRLNLTRANLIYSGGGHSYMVLPNTEQVKDILKTFEKEVNSWFLEMFDVALYIAAGYAECSANTLNNIGGNNQLSNLYRKVSEMVSAKKLKRYSAEDIIILNEKLNKKDFDGQRECNVCKSVGKLNKENVCPLCASLSVLASEVLKYKYFVVKDAEAGGLLLPFNKCLSPETQKSVVDALGSNDVRVYTKNQLHYSEIVGQNLWIGDYHKEIGDNHKGDEFCKLSDLSKGIKKIAVLRADVDNLGNTFVNGFDAKQASLIRSAVLSRQLSLFFKGYINRILRHPDKRYLTYDTNSSNDNSSLAVTIVYSGGDDVFLVGAWNEVIEAFINIKEALRKFTQGMLSISGGIGIYHYKYPISVIAKEVAFLEDCSKGVEGKNAITFFDESNAFNWEKFVNNVINQKLRTIQEFIYSCSDRGNSFLYHILELIRNSNEKINIARLVYLLSRLEPTKLKGEKEEDFDLRFKNYKNFSEQIYTWVRDKQNNGDKEQFISALLLYVYLTRDKQDGTNE